jgi:probable HAF family extracellular repeat protein
MRRRRLLIAFLCAAALVVAVLILRFAIAAPPRYTHTFLTTATGDPILPFSINDHGQVVGLARIKGGEFRIFLWDKDHGARDLGSFDRPKHSEPLRINNLGRITGSLRDPNGDFRAFIWDLPADKKILAALPGKSSLPLALNNQGQVVGFSYTSDGFPHAVLWNGDADITDLGTLGGPASLAGSINNSGQVVGFSQIASGNWHAFFWDPNTGFKDLGPTSITPPVLDYIHLNNKGFVVGRFGSTNDQMLISTWSQAEGVRPIPSMKGIDAHPIALNDANQFLLRVRSASLRLGGHWLFHHVEEYLWDTNEGFVPFKKNLGHRDISTFFPRDINNKGQIVGQIAQNKSKEPQGVLLEPIE